ncbi:MAG: hypothetical protein ACE5EX_10995, partial [Phycisphaerae bacterium]
MGAIVCVSAVSVAAQSSRPVITVHRPRIPESVLRYRRLLQKERPPLRGFRAPILDNAGERWPFRPPDDSGPIRQAADLVGRRLARDGLLATLARVLDILGPSSLPVADGDVLDLLRAVGLPVDLLPCFSFDDKNVSAAAIDVVRYIRRRLKAGATVNNLGDELGTATFRFRRSREDFRASTESGERAIGTIRLQLPTGTDWRGPGDGAAVDVARQLVTRLPDVSFLVDINEAHVDAFLSLARSWPLNRPGRLTAIVEPMPVAQWAQDNGKPGLVGPPDAPQIATLVPRYASRGEDGSIFVPDETFVADGLAATGHTVIQSPLIFQGGNLMSVRDPATGERIMLIGEAEVYRNTALGLTREQVIGAFKTEFAVDRCVVLPAVSFHIDFEVCVRAVGNRLVAFVNDTPAAVRIILGLGIDALVSHGSLDAGAARRGREHLAAGRLNELLAVIGPSVGRSRNRSGHFPNSLARHFACGPVDSGAANLQRFMLAMDIVT